MNSRQLTIVDGDGTGLTDEIKIWLLLKLDLIKNIKSAQKAAMNIMLKDNYRSRLMADRVASHREDSRIIRASMERIF